MKGQIAESEELYGYLPSPRKHTPWKAVFYPLDDNTLEDKETRIMVKDSRNECIGCGIRIWTEDLKAWFN